MTGQSSCKSFFKNYLLYRIGEQKANLALCCILNLLTLPLFVTAQIKGFSDNTSQLYVFGKYFSILCGIFLVTLAVVGTITSFEYYHKKNLTDTIGSLPLSYKQRFWGDLLSGYITNVAPVIPIGLISAIVAGGRDEFREYFARFERIEIDAVGFMIGLALSLIIALTFVYLFAVLIASACGKILPSVLFSIFGTAALGGTVAGIGGCFAVGMLGVDPAGYMSRAASFLPPLGSLIDLGHGIGFLSMSFSIELFDGEWWYPDRGEEFFAAAKIPNIACFVILGAALIFGAFCLGRSRKPEKTGSAFAVRPMFYALSSFFCTAAVFIITVLNVRAFSFGTVLITAAVGGVVVCAVSIVIYLPRSKELPKCIFCGMLAIGASVVVAFILKHNGSFGAAYLPENTKEIEYIRVDNEYTVTDKSDMKHFILNLNGILRRDRYDLAYGAGYSYTVEYKTTDGRVYKRIYSEISDDRNDPIYHMEELEKTMSRYGEYMFQDLLDFELEWNCIMYENGYEYYIPEQDKSEFLAVFSKEAAEKYDPYSSFANAVYANARFISLSYGTTRVIPVQKNFGETIAMLESIKGELEVDENEIVLGISYMKKDDETGEGQNFTIKIRNRDMDNALVKELFGLLKKADGSGDSDEYFFVNYPYSPSGDVFRYFIQKQDSKRVLEIMTELAISELEG